MALPVTPPPTRSLSTSSAWLDRCSTLGGSPAGAPIHRMDALGRCLHVYAQVLRDYHSAHGALFLSCHKLLGAVLAAADMAARVERVRLRLAAVRTVIIIRIMKIAALISIPIVTTVIVLVTMLIIVDVINPVALYRC